MTDYDFIDQINGCSLTTAEILYYLPDYPSLLQTFVWQCYDEHPHFPRLNRFLKYWSDNIEAKFHRITVAHNELISPAELKLVGNEFRLH